MTNENDAYIALANAVVVQAADDYRRIYRRFLRRPDNSMCQDELNTLERFFRSEYFELLTNVPAESILSRIREEELRRVGKRK